MTEKSTDHFRGAATACARRNFARGAGRYAAISALLLFVPALRAAVPEAQLPPPATITVDFGRDIKPILEQNCYKCHAGDRPRGRFRLTSREAALKGGSEGVDIIPHQSAKSPLIRYVARLDPEHEMPPE